MSNNEHIIRLKLALSENNFAQCFNSIYLILNNSADNGLKLMLNVLIWHKENAEKNKDENAIKTYKQELIKAINHINTAETLNLQKSSNIILTGAKFDKEGIIKLENKFANFREIFDDFCKQWSGKIKNKTVNLDIFPEQNFILLQENINNTSSEIYFELDLRQSIIYFRCWGDEKDIAIFLGRLQDWWDREVKEKGALRVFVSYAHVDEKWKGTLTTAFAILKQNKLIKIWHDRVIKAGDEWDKNIEQEIGQSQIILLLISPEFIASDYCYQIETTRALIMHQQGLSRVIPIYVRQAVDKGASFSHLQGLPKDKRPLSSFGPAKTDNRGIQQVAEAITDLVYEIHQTGKII
jgi:hypothetical protein